MKVSKIPRLTVAQVAEALQKSETAVRHAAAKHEIGTLVNPRMRLFSDSDVELLKGFLHERPGRPKKGE